MKLGLCMVVKNEERSLERSLKPIYDLFDSITVIDTGSTDRTVEILRKEYGIEPVIWTPDLNARVEEDRSWEPKARNLSLLHSQSPWVLTLDADEIISREDVLKIKAMEPDADGYFIKWKNNRSGEGFDDYKLCLFRSDAGVRYDGYMHTNPQKSFQERGLTAKWLDDVSLLHAQEADRPYRQERSDRLARYVQDYPENQRYKWFLGYTLYKAGQEEPAQTYLEQAARSLSREYPVECLNAHVVLAEIYNRQSATGEALDTVKTALQFFKENADHFEVKVNGRVRNWLECTKASIESSTNSAPKIKALEFPF